MQVIQLSTSFLLVEIEITRNVYTTDLEHKRLQDRKYGLWFADKFQSTNLYVKVQ